MPTLFPRANPRFCLFSMTWTSGKFVRINSTEPSVDPLSETMISKSVECVRSIIERRQSSITFKSFQQMMTIDSFTALTFRVPRLEQRTIIRRLESPRTRCEFYSASRLRHGGLYFLLHRGGANESQQRVPSHYALVPV